MNDLEICVILLRIGVISNLIIWMMAIPFINKWCGEVMAQYHGKNCQIMLTHEAETKWTPFRRRHFQVHFVEWKCLNSEKKSQKFVPKGPINNIPSLVQIMAWRRTGDKPLSEPMMVCLLTHICVTRPQWVKYGDFNHCDNNTDPRLMLYLSVFKWGLPCSATL